MKLYQVEEVGIQQTEERNIKSHRNIDQCHPTMVVTKCYPTTLIYTHTHPDDFPNYLKLSSNTVQKNREEPVLVVLKSYIKNGILLRPRT